MTRKPGRPPLPASAPVAVYAYLTEADKSAICEALRQCGSLSEAIRTVLGADRSPSVVYAAIRNDLVYQAQIEEARESYRNLLRKEIHRRAVTGVQRVARFQGKPVGVDVEYDSNLLRDLARSHLPEFIDKKSELSVSTSHQEQPGIWSISVAEVTMLSLESRRALASVLREIKSNKARLIGDRAALIEENRAEAEASGDELIEVTAPPDDPWDSMSPEEQTNFLLN